VSPRPAPSALETGLEDPNVRESLVLSAGLLSPALNSSQCLINWENDSGLADSVS
jgi:hypothetical protein